MIKIRSNRVRGLSFTSMGQQCEGWVPAGLYYVGEEKPLTYTSGMDRLTTQAIPVHNDRGTWYVAPNALRPGALNASS